MAEQHAAQSNENTDRRNFLSWCVMFGGLLSGYGLFAYNAVRFLLGAGPESASWFFVADLAGFGVGKSLDFRSPDGQNIVVTRLSDEDFIALSSVCPHLGCRVHWEAQNDRFFCPCHNGAFDATGKPTAGPPADANQILAQYPLKIENGLVFIELSSNSLT